MFGQADVGDEAWFGVEDLPCRTIRIHAQDQCQQTGHDRRIAGSLEVQACCVATGYQPDHRLAADHPVFLGLPLVRERGQRLADINQVLVALGPVAEEREFLGNGLLRRVGAEWGDRIHITYYRATGAAAHDRGQARVEHHQCRR